MFTVSVKGPRKISTDVPAKSFTLIIKEKGLVQVLKVPVKKGKSLYNAVQPILENNGLSCETHSLFLGSSNTPIPYLNSEVSIFRDQTIYARENEKTRSERHFSNILDNFDKPTSISDVVGNLTRIEEEQDGNVLHLENSWKEIIDMDGDLLTKRRSQQEGVWELLQTEVGYIKDLKIILDVFKRCFRSLQQEGYMTEVDGTLIFANIDEIYTANLTFWRKLKTVVDNAKNNNRPISPSHLANAFKGFESTFRPYIKFCNDDISNLKLPDFSPETNEMLKKYIDWCDNHKDCKRISLSGFLIKPLQRVTKYGILLKAIMDKTEDEAQRNIAEELMTRVETFVSKINSAVNLRQQREKLNSVVQQISDYFPFENFSEESEKIIRNYCKFDLKCNLVGLSEAENRFILKEGRMKLLDGAKGKKEVNTFLFTDMLVITKLKKSIDKYSLIREPYRLNKLVMHQLKDPCQLLFVYLNDYGVASNAFVLQVRANDKEKWKNAIEEAKADYELMTTEYPMSDDAFTDDEIIESPIPSPRTPEQKVMRRMSSKRKSRLPKLVILEVQKEEDVDVVEYEWDHTLTFVCLLFIFMFNFYLGSLIY